MNTPALTSDQFPTPSSVAHPLNDADQRTPSLNIGADRRPGFGVLVRVELRKMVDTRSGVALTAIIAALMVVVTAVMLALIGFGGVNQVKYFDFIFGAETGVQLLFPVLVVLLVTSEWSQRSAMMTFALVPDRGRVIAAKLGAALVATMIALAAVMTTAAVANLASAALGNTPLTWNIGWTSFGTYALSYLFNTLLAFALGVALLNSAAGLVSYYLVQLGIPTLLFGLGFVNGFGSIVKWIDPSAIGAVVDDPTVGANWAHLAVSTVLWIGIPFVVGVRRVLTTEIK